MAGQFGLVESEEQSEQPVLGHSGVLDCPFVELPDVTSVQPAGVHEHVIAAVDVVVVIKFYVKWQIGETSWRIVCRSHFLPGRINY